ncbi:MAG: DUF937 domain-containing protein [Actinomycetota bacterium]
MAGVMDELMEQLGRSGGDGGLGGMLGGLLGGGDDPDTAAKTEKAANLGMEAMLGGLARNAESKRGARSLAKALEKHDGSVLDDIPNALGSNQNTADGEKIVDHVFGDNKDQVVQSLAGKSGLDLGSVTKLLPMLAPLVMGMIGKKNSGGGAGALAGMLGQESGGFDLGDLVGMLGGGTGTKGGLGALLGGLFGGRR